MTKINEAVNALKLQFSLGLDRAKAINSTAAIFKVNAVELMQTLLAEKKNGNDDDDILQSLSNKVGNTMQNSSRIFKLEKQVGVILANFDTLVEELKDLEDPNVYEGEIGTGPLYKSGKGGKRDYWKASKKPGPPSKKKTKSRN